VLPIGVHLTVLIGPTLPVPAAPAIVEAVRRVEVTHSDDARSAFQITFSIGRSGPATLLDYALAANPLLRPFNRVILVVTFGALPRVLMDGVITNQQLQPGVGHEPGTLTVTGEDVSYMMDREDSRTEHPAQPEIAIVPKLVAKYARYGIVGAPIPPPSASPPLPIERTPTQQESDLKYIKALAAAYGYVFYVTPGPAPGTNTYYWGPPIRAGVPQRALSVNMAAETNVESIDFSYDATAPKLMKGKVLDRRTNAEIPIQTFTSTRVPLSAMPAILTNFADLRTEAFEAPGLDAIQAFAVAQGRTDASTDDVATANGTLDAVRYANLLEPRALVGLRGVGWAYDGFWYVKRVKHVIEPGRSYKQQFTLKRDGIGAISPVVVP
jgi:hypothetical protein